MNQIAAAILILSASITGYAAAVRPVGDNYGGIMTMIAIGLGLWGSLALLTSATSEREYLLDQADELDHLGRRPLRNSIPAATWQDDSVRDYGPAIEPRAPVTAPPLSRAASLADTSHRYPTRYSRHRVA